MNYANNLRRLGYTEEDITQCSDRLVDAIVVWGDVETVRRTLPAVTAYQKLYVDHVLQADEGVDFDFLVGRRGAFVPKDNH